MKRKPRLTKKQRKDQQRREGVLPAQPHAHHHHDHIHCTACGRHIDDGEFDEPATAMVVRCEHGSYFPTCSGGCADETRARLAEHDRTGQPVRVAPAHH